jgi:hypothetical protein
MLRGLIQRWEREKECCSLAKFGFDPDASSMCINDPLDERQVEIGQFEDTIHDLRLDIFK